MVTFFADGSKISFEQTILANATGAKVVQRGMSRGVPFDDFLLELANLYGITCRTSRQPVRLRASSCSVTTSLPP
jgi:predicted homoserine dehydrogenase-like protein